MKIMNKTLIYAVILFFTFIQISISQGKKIDITDNDYKFKLTLPDSWVKMKYEETKNHDGISYVYNNKKDSTITCMIMSFKVPESKDINDFIYVLELDASLNIPQRNSDFTNFDFGSYDGKYAIYKDLQSTELIYYIRTKNDNSKSNFVYMLRFITTNYNKKVEQSFKDIAGTFQLID